jgi:hypothetical protein
MREIHGIGSNRIPDVAVHVIIIDAANNSRLYVGTDLAVFTSTDGGAEWMQEITGFAKVVTESLKIGAVGGVNNLFALTHGRRAWRTSTEGSALAPFAPSLGALTTKQKPLGKLKKKK